jgi:hypothetical protein
MPGPAAGKQVHRAQREHRHHDDGPEAVEDPEAGRVPTDAAPVHSAALAIAKTTSDTDQATSGALERVVSPGATLRRSRNRSKVAPANAKATSVAAAARAACMVSR